MPLRLTPQQRQIIVDTVREIFGSEATVTLFGSRVDENARGGDIDLLIQTDKPLTQREKKTLQLIARLQIRLGDQPIDALVLDPETSRLPVHEIALRTGVRL
jgi:predicted nucleotidyltransferase